MSVKRLDALSVTVVGLILVGWACYDLISHYNVFVDFGTAFLWTLAPVFPLQKCGLHLPVPCFSFLSAGHALIIFSWTLSETTGLALCVGLLGGAAV